MKLKRKQAKPRPPIQPKIRNILDVVMPWKTEEIKYGKEHQKGPEGIIIKCDDPWAYDFEGVKNL